MLIVIVVVVVVAVVVVVIDVVMLTFFSRTLESQKLRLLKLCQTIFRDNTCLIYIYIDTIAHTKIQ